MGKVVVCPFDPEYVTGEGAASRDEFRIWLVDNGDSFSYSLTTAQTGDVIVFAWKDEPGKWTMISDAIVKTNHAAGSKGCVCDPTKDRKFARHILTGGLRLYPRTVSSGEMKLNLGRFVDLAEKQYLGLLELSVDHWRERL